MRINISEISKIFSGGHTMKIVILAGGFGTRISEESQFKPKPMIEIDDMPILWHIMKYYSSYGFNEFVICLGYKGYVIKNFFANYFLHTADCTLDLESNTIEYPTSSCEPWKITLIDTGLNTMTGGRVKRIKDYIKNETFMITYGDGVADVNLTELLKFHKKEGKILTLTAIQKQERFGVLGIDDNSIVTSFREKTIEDAAWINGGYMVAEPELFDYIENDQTILEKAPMIKLSEENQLVAFKHYGFWQCMDTLRDKQLLESLLEKNKAPWKVW